MLIGALVNCTRDIQQKIFMKTATTSQLFFLKINRVFSHGHKLMHQYKNHTIQDKPTMKPEQTARAILVSQFDLYAIYST